MRAFVLFFCAALSLPGAALPGALMVASVLYAKAHPENPRAGVSAVLALALKLGEILAAETALFSSTVHLAGRVFGNREWETLGARILHRYAAEEQSPDGYWGEHSLDGPTTAYDYLTVTGFFDAGEGGFEHLGRLAQDALYYHEGPLAPIPQDAERYVHRMSVPAGIRKTGPWVVCLSGIVATQNVASRYYLDRQSSLEVFHQKYGLILSGANSKRQPELAIFRERIGDEVYHMPLDTRLHSYRCALPCGGIPRPKRRMSRYSSS